MTINRTGCTDISTTSDLLSDYLGNPTGRTLTLVSSINCCTTDQITTTIVVGDITVDTYIVLPALFSLSDFVDGIYTFKLRLTESDSSYTEETNCTILLCSLQCDVVQYLAKYPDDFEANNLYQALTYAEECDECSCEAACTIYEKIINKLKNANFQTNVDLGCGC